MVELIGAWNSKALPLPTSSHANLCDVENHAAVSDIFRQDIIILGRLTVTFENQLVEPLVEMKLRDYLNHPQYFLECVIGISSILETIRVVCGWREDDREISIILPALGTVS